MMKRRKSTFDETSPIYFLTLFSLFTRTVQLKFARFLLSRGIPFDVSCGRERGWAHSERNLSLSVLR